MEVKAPEVQPVTEEVKPVETPVEAPKTDDPVAPTAPSPEAVQEVTQYDLPDGTKTDAEGLSKAWRDKFMPDYTRKSQELAAIKNKTEPKQEAPAETKAPWEDPNWQPENYKQLIDASKLEAKKEVWQEILNESQREEREARERDAYVQQETEQLKAFDPKVDVGRVMAHAAKYAFPSLIPAYQNLRAIEDAERRTEERIMKNIKLRASEPVGTASVQPNATPSFPPDVRTGLEKARWLIRNNK